MTASRACLREDDFYICYDSGLKHREGLDIETIVFSCEKDDTDTAFAVKEALKRGFQDFLLVGVIGGRLDHTLGNTSLLLMLEAQGKRAVILDDYSEMEIVSRKPAFIQNRYAYFSLLNIS